MDDRALQDRLDAQAAYDALANVDAEQGVIGAVLLNNDAFRKVCDIVQAEHFTEELHRRIWSIIVGQMDKGEPATPITLKTYLGDGDLGGGMTPAAYLARLMSEGVTVMNAAGYAKTVRLIWIRRQLHRIGIDVTRVALDAPVEATAESILSDIEMRLEEIRPQTAQDADFVSFGAAARKAVEIAAAAHKRGGGLSGLSTGLPNLDEKLGGLQNSDLIILAGRPSMGKTALATNIARSVAAALLDESIESQAPQGIVGFFSLEMSAAQLADRIIADRSGVPSFKIRKGYANDHDWNAYMDMASSMERFPLLIDQTGGISIATLRTRARSLHKRRRLRLLVVDYLQLLTGTAKSAGNRTQEVTEITMGLKALAKELDIPIIALSQLSRKVEEREDKRPMLSDLRESGSIEQDADVVMFAFREEYYLERHEPRHGTDAHLAWQRQVHAAAGVAHVIIGKNRHGPVTTVELGFKPAYTRFINEPEPRDDLPVAPAREREQKKELSDEAKDALALLRGLVIASDVKNDGSYARVPAWAELVDYTIWREELATRHLPPEFTAKEAVKFAHEKCYTPLMRMGLVERGGTPDRPVIYLTDKGKRV